MISKPEMFKRPCLILAVCIASISLFGFVLIFSPLSPLRSSSNIFKIIVIVFLPQLVFIGSALSANMPPLVRVVLALGLAFIPSLIHARILAGIWKRNLFMNDRRSAISVGVMIFLVLPAVAAVYFMPLAKRPVRPGRTLPKKACMHNVRTLVQMCHMYSFDYDGYFPPGFKALDRAGYPTGNLTSCPAAGGKADYGLNTAATMDCPPDTPLIGDFDSGNHRDVGGNIGYVDGRVRWYDGEYSAGSGPLKDVLPEDWVRE